MLVCTGGLFTVQNADARHSESHIKPITLQLSWKHQFQFAGYYAAKAQGFYRDAGLDVTILPHQPGDNKPVDKVLGGQAEFAVGNTSLLIDRSHYKPIKLLANIFQHNPNILITLESSGIQSVSQMTGKRISLSERDDTTLSILKTEGISQEQLQFSHHQSAISALMHGKVDIISGFSSDELELFEQRGIDINVIESEHIKHTFYGDNLFTSEHMILNQPETVRAFLNASLKGWKYALDFPHEIIELIQRKYSQEKSRASLEFEANALKSIILPHNTPLGDINLERLQKITQIYQSLSLISKDFAPIGILDNLSYTSKNPLSLSAAEQDWIEANPVIKIGVNPDLAPFEFIDKHGDFSGMSADYIKLIALRSGLELEVQKNLSWSQVLDEVKAGKIDVLSSVTRSDDKKQFLNFVPPHIFYPMAILSNKTNHGIHHSNDLAGKKVIIIADEINPLALQSNHIGIEIITTDNIKTAFKMLASNEADAFLGNLPSITQNISELGYTNLQMSATSDYEYALSIGVTKDKPILSRILGKAMQSITPEEKREISKRWIKIDHAHGLGLINVALIGLVSILFLSIMAFWNRKLTKEVKRRKDFEKELTRSEKQFRELFENNKAVELIINPVSNKIIAANNAAINFYGYSENIILQLTLADITVYNVRDYNSSDNPAPFHDSSKLYYRHQLSDGKVRDVEVHSGPIKWNGQELNYLIIHDITDRIKAEKALITAKSDAEQATRVKSDFLANMSHEIRTPMNSVLGMTELLQDSPLNEEQKELLNILQHSSKTLISIINDILDFSKLEANKMVAEKVPFQLQPFIQELTDSFKLTASEKDIELIYELNPDSDVVVFNDSTKLHQILSNLISNAIKFTYTGSITLNVSQTDLFEDNGIFRFEVIDTGIGIDQNIIPGLFESFIQADNSTTRQFGGTGLGLAICKKLAHLLDGHIQVSSDPGHGTTFTVEIPMEYKVLSEQEKEQRQASNKIAQNEDTTSLSGHVLVAEDIKPNQILIQKMLSKFGLTCDIAENGQLAVIKAQNNTYDLILMDSEMPIMDGYSATKQIRLINLNIPIIALTANISAEDHRKAILSGMNEVLTKPVSLVDLSKVLNRWL